VHLTSGVLHIAARYILLLGYDAQLVGELLVQILEEGVASLVCTLIN
jgi:hypothetical protein